MSNRKKSMETDSVVATNEPDSTDLPNQDSSESDDSKKRKLHPTHISRWTEDISNSGFTRCMTASCNFVSSDILKMQEHYISCKGVSLSGKNLCKSCGCFFATSQEFVCHKAVCQGAKSFASDSRQSSTATRKRHQKWFCTNKGCSFTATKLADMEEHSKSCIEVPNFSLFSCIHCRCGFSTKEEHLKHQENCKASETVTSNSKKPDHLHFRVIREMKNDSSDEHIIQPGPDLPEGQYRRRRAYRAAHKKSWAIMLEKFKYVKCIYQNCYFIAMSLEDMIAHFGYCNGDGSFAKFVCQFCNGRVTSESVLLKHIERSHPLEITNVKVEPVMGNHDVEDLNKNSDTQNGNESTQDLESLICQGCQQQLQTGEDLTRHASVCGFEKVNNFPVNEKIDKPLHRRVEEDIFLIGPVVRQYKSNCPKKGQSKQRKVNVTNVTGDTHPHTSTEKTENTSLESSAIDTGTGTIQNTTPAPPKKRGRPKKNKEETAKPPEEDGGDGNDDEKKTCAKCKLRCTQSAFVCHNLKKHFGLSWLEGEEPVDLNDDKLVTKLVKKAFKYTKKAACEKCDVVKRSVMGFVSHVQVCGKTDEEVDAMKVQCPQCGCKYLRYTLAAHIKLSHPDPDEEEKEKSEKSEKSEASVELPEKRRSAIKAVTKFQQVLNENDEVEVTTSENHYIFYERGSERMPKLNSKLNNLWYKLKRENKKIPCRHPNCTYLSNDVKEAKNHHYNCSHLPEKVFLCEFCDFYSVDEPSVKSHLMTHRKYMKMRRTTGEEEVKPDDVTYENEEEDNEEEEVGEEEEEEGGGVRSSEEELEDLDESRKRKKKKNEGKMRKKPKFSMDSSKSDLEIEGRLKQNFCRREKIDSIRGIQFFSSGLEMTLQEEEKMSEKAESWPELHTTMDDWCYVPIKQAMQCLPKIQKSVAVRLPGDDGKWKTFERFESDLIGGVPVLFTGGSVRSMSWCKVSFSRMVEKTQKQFLAVTTAGTIDNLTDIYNQSLAESSLLQIWDCGPLDNDLAKNPPKFALGMVQPGGEIWDLAWFPQDTFAEAAEERMRRLGLLATACEDGAVRIWSICDPDQLDNTKGLPVYKTDPVAMLVIDKDVAESCFKLSVGLNGVIAGGFGNGTVAVWNVKNVSSPFCKRLRKCKIIRAHLVLQSHKAAITGLTFCPSNSRYISTAGLDRYVKVWDLEFPDVPIEQSNKEYSLDNIWTLNWPSLIYNFDDVVISLNKGAVKFIKDILTDRHQSMLAMEDTCLVRCL